MSALDQLVNFVLLVIILVSIGLVGGYVYLVKNKKFSKKIQKLNYNKFDRKDAIEFAKFDNIVSGNTMTGFNDSGMVVLENGNRFVASLEVEGFNYHTSSSGERTSCVLGMQSFLNVVKTPIQVRQSARKVDLTKRINHYKKILETCAYELMELDIDYQNTLSQAEVYLRNGDEESYKRYEDALFNMQGEITALTWKKDHSMMQIDYLELITEGGEMERYQCYLYDWTFDKMSFQTELTTEEIYQRALVELETKGNAYLSALAACNVSGRRLGSKEYLDLIRRHNKPITGETFTIDDVYNSSVTSLFVTSDSIEEAIKIHKEEQEYEALKNSILEEYSGDESLLEDSDFIDKEVQRLVDEKSIMHSNEEAHEKSQNSVFNVRTINNEVSMQKDEENVLLTF